MIILDTNVISQLTRDPTPIESWITREIGSDLRLSATTVTEIVYGLERLPPGQRRRGLEEQWHVLEQQWRQRILDITPEIAHIAGRCMAEKETSGRRLTLADAQIAGTALVHDAVLATRNTKDFDDLGIRLVNPWE